MRQLQSPGICGCQADGHCPSSRRYAGTGGARLEGLGGAAMGWAWSGMQLVSMSMYRRSGRCTYTGGTVGEIVHISSVEFLRLLLC